MAVVGPPGSGKSTLARRLAERADLDAIDLDELFHGPGWAEPPTQEFRLRVAEALQAAEAARGGWAVAGNYSIVADLVQARAATIVWLDFDRRHTMPRVLRRSLRRSLRREQLWNGNRERWRDLVHPSRSILAEAWRKAPTTRAKYETLSQTPLWASAEVVRLRTPSDVERILVARA
ncbi:MAG: AAA family ATPase [Actinomycetota bacterium]